MDDSFIPGLYVFPPHERAASFVKAKLSIKPEQLMEWLRNAKANEKGYVSIDVLESKSGKWYAKLDTYVRKEQKDAPDTNDSSQFPADGYDTTDVPF